MRARSVGVAANLPPSLPPPSAPPTTITVYFIAEGTLQTTCTTANINGIVNLHVADMSSIGVTAAMISTPTCTAASVSFYFVFTIPSSISAAQVLSVLQVRARPSRPFAGPRAP